MLLDAQAALNRLRALLETLATDSAAPGGGELSMEASPLSSVAHTRSDQPRLTRAVSELQVIAKELTEAKTGRNNGRIASSVSVA